MQLKKKKGKQKRKKRTKLGQQFEFTGYQTLRQISMFKMFATEGGPFESPPWKRKEAAGLD